MVLESLRSAVSGLSHFSHWLPGIASGLFAASFVLLQYYSGLFLAERIWILEMVVFPFFVAGLMYQVNIGQHTLGSFFSGGVSFYFRVLLPSLVVFFGVLLTLFLLMIPLMALGLAETALVFMVFSVSVSVLFFTFFYDAAAVFEGRKVFDSIRRSVEFVLRQTHACLIFYLVSLAIGCIIFFGTMIIWTALLYDRLESIATMSTADLQNFTFEQFNFLLGADGILISAVLLFIALTVTVSVIYGFKACFFRDSAETEPVEISLGEYDQKGRWFKY
ncbi:MAG: hypothetical protein LUO81_04295 [Methanoregulaceae archaeon]|nr:hypothetical protein [Methanoregulaceae archaeon]